MCIIFDARIKFKMPMLVVFEALVTYVRHTFHVHFDTTYSSWFQPGASGAWPAGALVALADT